MFRFFNYHFDLTITLFYIPILTLNPCSSQRKCPHHLIHPHQPPSHLQNPRPHKTRQPQPIASPHECNQRCISPPITRNELSRNRDPHQTPKRHHSIQTRIPPPKHLRPTKLSHTHRRQANIRTAPEPKHQREDDQLRYPTGSVFG